MNTRLALLSGDGKDTFNLGKDPADAGDTYVPDRKSKDTLVSPRNRIDTYKGITPRDIQDTTPSEITGIDSSQEKLSKKDLLNDDDYFKEILQYREDRFGTDQTVGASYVMLPFFKQELTKENIVDDYLDHYRFITGNEIEVASELDWLKSLKKKEEIALGYAKSAIELKDQDRFLAEAQKLSGMRQRAAKLYSKTSKLAELYDGKRYEGMSGFEKLADVVDTVGGHIATQISSPLTILSVGAGKFVAKKLAEKTGLGTISQILIASATTAPIDATQAGVVDVIAQGSEIEMGIRDDYDMKRTATVAGVSGVVSGTLSGVGQRIALRKGSGLTKEGIEKAVKEVKNKQQQLARTKIKELGGAKEYADKFAKDIEDTFGKKAVQRNSSGKVVGIDTEVIKKAGREKLESLDKAGYQIEIVEPAMNLNTYERVLAGVGELFERGRDNIEEFLNIDEGLARALNIDRAEYIKQAKSELNNLFRPLGKNEQISERVFAIMMNEKGFIKKDLPLQILAKYGVTNKDFSAMMLSEISRAGKKLGTVAQLPRKLAQANRLQTAEEVAEEAHQIVVNNRFQDLYYRFENIRRGTLVSGIATAQRNALAQIPRSVADSLIYSLESIMNPNKKFSVRGSLSKLRYTFYDYDDGALISNALLENFDFAKAKMWNQYSEVGHKLKQANPNQDALSRVSGVEVTGKKIKAPKGLDQQRGVTDSVLDKWEGLIHHFNVFNRFQESVFRRGAFNASIERQVINKYGKDVTLNGIMKEGTFLKYVDEDMMAKGVNDALEFTFAAQPKFKPFAKANEFMSNYLTLLAPFPRFMFKAMEMTYNYNATGALTGAYRTIRQATQRGGFKQVDDGAYKQMAEGLVGFMALMPLGYMLRDPENGIAGTEWYTLKDNKGNEFDARVYGPIITPYLLINEMIHRYNRGVQGVGYRDVLQGVTGANFRSFNAIDRTLGEFINLSQSGDSKQTEIILGGLGRVLGEAWSGYGQFFLQFSDMASESDRRRDYKKDPIYKETFGGKLDHYLGLDIETSLDAFLQEFSLPMKRRIDAFVDDPDLPFAQDPRLPNIPERVLPFMKVLFGATLNRVPPRYIVELGTMGFGYEDFMAKTAMPSINRVANKYTGLALQEEMTHYLSSLKMDPKGRYNTDGKFDYGKASGEVDSYIKSIKKQSLAQAKLEVNNEDEILGMLIRFKSISPLARMSAQKKYIARKQKELGVTDYEIDFTDLKEVTQVFNEASNIRSSGDLKRNFTPDRAQRLFK